MAGDLLRKALWAGDFEGDEQDVVFFFVSKAAVASWGKAKEREATGKEIQRNRT